MKEIQLNNPGVLTAPPKPNHLPEQLKWLSGEGCGSWFLIEESNLNTMITRYSPDGKMECKGIFMQIEGIPINLNIDFQITYMSHCAEVNLIQKSSLLKFKLLQKC